MAAAVPKLPPGANLRVPGMQLPPATAAPVDPAEFLFDLAELGGTVAFGVAGSLTSLYGLVVPVTPTRALAESEAALRLWRIPDQRVLLRALGYHSARTMLWVARAMTADVACTAVLGVIRGPGSPPWLTPTTALTAGVLGTALFAPLFMQLDRCTVREIWPTADGMLSEGSGGEAGLPVYSAATIRDVVILTLVHDSAQALLPGMVAGAIGQGMVGATSGWLVGVALLKPVAAVANICSVENVPAADAWNILTEDSATESGAEAATQGTAGAEGPTALSGVPRMWRAIPVELSVMAAAGVVHIGLLMTVPLVHTVTRNLIR